MADVVEECRYASSKSISTFSEDTCDHDHDHHDDDDDGDGDDDDDDDDGEHQPPL